MIDKIKYWCEISIRQSLEVRGKPLSYSSFRFWAGFIWVKSVGSGFFLTELRWENEQIFVLHAEPFIFSIINLLTKKKVRKKACLLKCVIYRDLKACLKMRFEVLQSAGFPHTSVIYLSYSCKRKQDFTTCIKWLTDKTAQTQRNVFWIKAITQLWKKLWTFARSAKRPINLQKQHDCCQPVTCIIS